MNYLICILNGELIFQTLLLDVFCNNFIIKCQWNIISRLRDISGFIWSNRKDKTFSKRFHSLYNESKVQDVCPSF